LFRSTARPALALLFAAGMTAAGIGSAMGAETQPAAATPATAAHKTPAPAGSNAGPPYDYVTVLNGQFVTIPLKDQGLLIRTAHGYRFRTGQQNSHLTVTRVAGGLRFVDTGTERFQILSGTCQRQKAKLGVAAVCQIPAKRTVKQPVMIEVWPRLGNDFTDTSSLPATFVTTVLGDGGNDTAHLGPGADFFNGAMGRDFAWGDGGNDWMRAGTGNDTIVGGAGNDYMIGQEGIDRIHGGVGNDRVDGGDNDDQLWGNAGADFVLCGSGRDTATVDSADRIYSDDCESVKH
jgi:serralysin